ncbi:MAG: zinc-binding alcohol dehydrogenase [Chloroflexota bacterium]
MKRQVLIHQNIRSVEVIEEECPLPKDNEVLIQTRYSGISAGTESLIYRGLFPENLLLDETLSSLSGEFSYPFRYGYCCVGKIIECGKQVDRKWLGVRVFAFYPHCSYFTSPLSDLLPLPDILRDEDAVFIPNMETAVNLLQDGRPILGESVAVFGLGMVGLLTTALLGQFPLGFLGCLDLHPHRRQIAFHLGADVALNPLELWQSGSLREAFISAGLPQSGADLIYELSGSPAALNQAIELCGFNSRIVVGSWYGKKSVPLDLGGLFHRNRISIISSQVSTISPALSGRWDKSRRFQVVYEQLENIKPGNWISHYVPLTEADQFFDRLVDSQSEILQAVFTYS